MKYKIRYKDTMTTYLLDETFSSENKAESYIADNLGETSCYEIEEVATTIAEKVKIIDDVITREVNWADEPTDDIQDAWVDIKYIINKFYKEVE
tara:strand:+ start:142 stop:423 length:282 start_codon:yes stop_codon:yes gene_type:complete